MYELDPTVMETETNNRKRLSIPQRLVRVHYVHETRSGLKGLTTLLLPWLNV